MRASWLIACRNSGGSGGADAHGRSGKAFAKADAVMTSVTVVQASIARRAIIRMTLERGGLWTSEWARGGDAG